MKLYCAILYTLVTAIVLPGAAAYYNGAGQSTLVAIAAVQLLVSLLLWVSLPASGWLLLLFAISRNWRAVGWAALAMPAPLLSFVLIGLTNKPGLNGVMSA